MPRVDPSEFESLPLEAKPIVREFAPLHDIWQVELEGERHCTLPELRAAMTAERLRALPWVVRTLFGLRSILGRLFRLDSTPGEAPARQRLAERVPSHVADASSVRPGTMAGPFEALYVLPDEAAYQVLNATVHAIVVVALTRTESTQRLFWATYVRPVGRITSLYMRLIDPFRRVFVYPGLESWLKKSWREASGVSTYIEREEGGS